uniref:Uncharacterized protein n=1 Tax=Plectus sambesii TaxID=2011161 RepID=A0A914X5B8_9BILA
MNSVTAAFSFVVLFFALIAPCDSQFNRKRQGDRVKVDVYIEAQCPFSTKFMHNQLIPFVRKYPNHPNLIDLRVIPHGNTVCHKGIRRIHCTCFHGFAECQLNQLMNCVIKHHPYIYDHLETLSCIQGQPDLASAQFSCIRGRPDEASLMRCTKSYKGRKLLLESGYTTNRAGVNIVPWVTLNGWFNDPASIHFEREVCNISPNC